MGGYEYSGKFGNIFMVVNDMVEVQITIVGRNVFKDVDVGSY